MLVWFHAANVSLQMNYNVGDSVIASVIDTELEDGYSLLSLRKAAKDRGWDEVMAKLESGEIITVVPYDANRGGLLVEYEVFADSCQYHNCQLNTILA